MNNDTHLNTDKYLSKNEIIEIINELNIKVCNLENELEACKYKENRLLYIIEELMNKLRDK